MSTAHGYGMKVIMDFVANHSAIDCRLAQIHPSGRRDCNGKPQSRDSAGQTSLGFNYRNRDLRNYMIETMCYYVKECDIGGYRCDVAALVPTDFWCAAKEALKNLKPDISCLRSLMSLHIMLLPLIYLRGDLPKTLRESFPGHSLQRQSVIASKRIGLLFL